MEYVDLKGFEEFVISRGLVKETHLSFYVHWVRRFLQAEFSRSELAERDKVACFADQLAKGWGHVIRHLTRARVDGYFHSPGFQD